MGTIKKTIKEDLEQRVQANKKEKLSLSEESALLLPLINLRDEYQKKINTLNEAIELAISDADTVKAITRAWQIAHYSDS